MYGERGRTRIWRILADILLINRRSSASHFFVFNQLLTSGKEKDFTHAALLLGDTSLKFLQIA